MEEESEDKYSLADLTESVLRAYAVALKHHADIFKRLRNSEEVSVSEYVNYLRLYYIEAFKFVLKEILQEEKENPTFTLRQIPLFCDMRFKDLTDADTRTRMKKKIIDCVLQELEEGKGL